jgi:drug/metabolite transporter (DMT)-like permease
MPKRDVMTIAKDHHPSLENPDTLASRNGVVIGVGLMLLAGVMSSVLHIGVRTLSPHLPTIEIVSLRATFTLLMTLPVVLWSGQVSWRTNNLKLQMLRGVVGVCSMTTWYWALGVMPLADAGVLSFTTGIFVTIGAALWFREAVGWRRWTAVICGIVGAIIVLRPGSGVVTWGAIAAVGSSMLWAVSLLMAKELAKYDSSITITFYQPLMILPFAIAATVPVWVMPTPAEWALLLVMGLAAAIGNYGYVHALRVTDASITMPADYVRLVWMVMWGYILFGEIPLVTMWIGAALIVGSTLWITWREQQLARARRRAAVTIAEKGQGIG